MDGQIETESIRLSFALGAMHLGINQLTIKSEVDTVNQATRSALHLVSSSRGFKDRSAMHFLRIDGWCVFRRLL